MGEQRYCKWYCSWDSEDVTTEVHMGAPSAARNSPCELSEVCEASIGCAELSQPETWRLLSQQTLLSERELGARVPKESVQTLVNEFVLENLTVVLANLYLKRLLLARNDVFKSWMSWSIAFMGGKKQLSEESLLGMNGTLRLNPNIVKQQQQKNQNVYFSDLSSTMCNVGKPFMTDSDPKWL